MEELIYNIKCQIIEALCLEDIKPDDIDTDTPLFSNGLGLDSIDILELIVVLDKYYGIKLTSAAEGKRIFTNVRSIAEYVAVHRTK